MGKTFQVEGLEQKHQTVVWGIPAFPLEERTESVEFSAVAPSLPTHHHGRTGSLCGLAVLWRKERVRAVL